MTLVAAYPKLTPVCAYSFSRLATGPHSSILVLYESCDPLEVSQAQSRPLLN